MSSVLKPKVSGLGVSSQSRVNAVLTCSMKAHFQYDRKLSPKKTPDSLLYGTILHNAIEIIINGGFDDLFVEAAIDSGKKEIESKMLNQSIRFKGWTDDQMFDVFLLHVRDFIAWYEQVKMIDQSSFNVLATEVEFTTVMPFGNRWSGYADAIFFDQNDDGTRTIYIVDWKTSRSAIPTEFSVLDAQLAGYAELFKHSDMYLEGDIIKVGFGVFKKNKSGGFIPPDFKVVSPAATEAFYGSIEAAIALRSIPPVRMPASAYNTPCRMCEFHKLCVEGDDEGLVVRK